MVKIEFGKNRIYIKLEMHATVYIDPDPKDPAFCEDLGEPIYSKQASLARVRHEDANGKHALLISKQLSEMSTYLGDFIAANALSKL